MLFNLGNTEQDRESAGKLSQKHIFHSTGPKQTLMAKKGVAHFCP
jgi:hypothetical protein